MIAILSIVASNDKSIWRARQTKQEPVVSKVFLTRSFARVLFVFRVLPQGRVTSGLQRFGVWA